MSRSVESHESSARRPRDVGSSLLLVLVTMTILSTMVTVGLKQTLGTTRFADTSADWKQALEAAESGVDDYLARLNRDDGYWQSGPSRGADCGNVALKGDPAVTGTVSSCGWGAGTPLGWRKVVGSKDAEFHYDVDVRDTAVDGTVKLRSTGRVKGRTRTLEVTLRRGGFGEFLYYTVYETLDPADERVYGVNDTKAQTECSRYYWGSPSRTDYCDPGDINFVTGDKINGPMHTNDAMLISGNPRFQGTTTTSYSACYPLNGVPRPATSCYRKNGSTNPTFVKGISYRGEITLPTSIGDLRQYVTAGSTPAASLGCLYTGPTRIVFNPAPTGTPTMRVWSKWSGRTGGPTLNPGCGSAADLQSTAGASVNVPQNKVIMVQDVPSTQKTTNRPPSGACATGSIGDGLPIANDYNATLAEAECYYGTLFVEGTLKGRVTMSADNNIVITNNLQYQGGENGTDVLGLIASNSVKIYHPVRQTCTETDSRGRCTRYSYTNLTYKSAVLTNVTLHAAVLTLQHSFGVQSYQYGAKLGTLKVFGSLAQRFRGPVGLTGSAGYLKDYNYDSRLRYAPPPYFLDPVQSGWGLKVFGEVPPRYGS